MQIVVLLIIGLVISRNVMVAGTDYYQSGHTHLYNLEYDEAIADFAKLIERNPADPISYNQLAGAQLYKELHRLGLLDSSALRRDQNSPRGLSVEADPLAKRRFLETLERGQRVAENIIKYDRQNQPALYALCTDHALRSTYDFMLDKSWLSAARSGSTARGFCEEVRKLDPAFIDAYLVLGIFEYATGSLPLPVRLLAAVGGLHGSKNKGIEYMTRVARQGNYDRDAARVALAVLSRREKRPKDAAAILEALMMDYPRNYLFGLELASAYTDADRPERALDVLKSLLQSAYDRFPRATVQMQVEALEERLSSQRAGSAHRAGVPAPLN
jgi:tetratricopeptide (TPR) repeat protein